MKSRYGTNSNVGLPDRSNLPLSHILLILG